MANAIYDGTDAVMLSGETSIGQYPEEAVKVMAEVAVEAEAALPYESILEENLRHLQPEVDDAISYDACRTAYQLNASLIVAFTESGSTAGRVSKYRPNYARSRTNPEPEGAAASNATVGCDPGNDQLNRRRQRLLQPGGGDGVQGRRAGGGEASWCSWPACRSPCQARPIC